MCVKELHNFRSVLSIKNGNLYNGYNLQQNVTIIYSPNNLEIYFL